jgi:PST family polysaccharide transporter
MQLSEDKKRLLSNFFSLTVLQGLNMFLPLVTLPYLVRVLEVENFGLINFVLSIVMYFNILVSFGFELSATREISIHRDDNKKVSSIFSSVMFIKIFLFLLSLLILTLLILNIDSFKEHAPLYYATFGLVLGNVLFPTWFFQGIEQMKYITYINFIVRVAFTGLIFVFVKEQNDFIYVPLLTSIGAILGGLYSLWLVFKLYKIELIVPSREEIIEHLKESYMFFLSRVANDGSRFYAITLIGATFGHAIVGYYSMVEKLYFAFMSVGGIVAQTIYPYMSRTKNIQFFKKILSMVSLAVVGLLIPVLYFHNEILNLVFGIESEMASAIFIIIFSGSIFGVINALMGYPLLAAFGYINHANNSLIYASFIYVVIITITALVMHNIYWTSFSVVLYALSALLFRLYYIYKTELFSKKMNKI